MILHHPVTTAFPFLIIMAEVGTAAPFSWMQILLVYGPLGLWVGWFIIRDKLDREERKQERIDIAKRHQENLDAQNQMASSMRTLADLFVISVAAFKTMDKSYVELLEKTRDHNKQ